MLMDSLSHDKLGLDSHDCLELSRRRSRKAGVNGYFAGRYVVGLSLQAGRNPLYIVFAAGLCHKNGKISKICVNFLKKGIDFIENFAIIG